MRKQTGGRLRILFNPPTSSDDEVVVEWRLAPEGTDLDLETFVLEHGLDKLSGWVVSGGGFHPEGALGEYVT